MIKKEEILEKNKKNLNPNGDERELFINGQANIIAKSVFTVTIMLLILFNIWKGLNVDELWGIFFVYCATETLYKYHSLKDRKRLITGLLFVTASVCALLSFIIRTITGA